jgi:hypothetical protein
MCEPERKYVSLDDFTIRELARKDPALFFQRYPPPLIIDEVQYAPELLTAIKTIADERNEKGLFWLTGSQQFHLMRGVSESLAGRVAVAQLHGFSLAELCGGEWSSEPFIPGGPRNSPPILDDSAIFDVIWRGSYPAVALDTELEPESFYSSYMQTYLQRDVRDITQVADLARFTLFLRACAARTGQLLNLTELSSDVGISVLTAKSWLSVLETSGLVFLLQPWHSKITKRLVKTPKLYFLDTGLCAYLTGWSSPRTLANGAMAGPIFKTWTIAEILRSWWYRLKPIHAWFFRDKDGSEIDLVLEKDGLLFPIEIKRGAAPERGWIRHFPSLDRFGRGAGAALSLSPQRLPLDEKSWALPVSDVG